MDFKKTYSPCSCQQCKEDGSVAFLHSVPASGCASVAALAPARHAVGTLPPGQLQIQETAGSAGEAWRGSSVGWEVEAGRGVQA